MSLLGIILLVLLVMLLIGTIPAYPYSRRWGYAPSGLFGVLLAVVIILLLFKLI